MEYNHKIEDFLAKNKLYSNDIEQVKIAFTHPSFTNEKGLEYNQNYERLEFLGDAVLKLIASKYLLNKYPNEHEGELTKIRSIIVSDQCLSKFATNIELSQFLVFGHVEFNTHTGIPESVLACSFEALLGALYQTSSFNSIENFLIDLFDGIIEDVKENLLFVNAKAILQEYTQSVDKKLPIYEVINEDGPEHSKIFEVEVYYQEKLIGTGKGKTKKEAQQNAAIDACQKLKLLTNRSKMEI